MMEVTAFAADTLGMELHVHGKDLSASELRYIPFGPWKIEVFVEADSDVVNPKESSFWIRFGKHLWFYLIVRQEMNMLYAFDATEIGMTDKNRWKFGGITCRETLHQIEKAIKATFHFDVGKKKWQRVAFTLEDVPR